jgi:hypothetical protein
MANADYKKGNAKKLADNLIEFHFSKTTDKGSQ